VAVPEALVRWDSPGQSWGQSLGKPPAASPDNPVHAQIARLDRELAHAQIARLEGELAGMSEALAKATARASAKTARAIAAFEQATLRLEVMRPSAPSSRGGGGFSGGSDETESSGQIGGD
jgi:hypothetical protein